MRCSLLVDRYQLSAITIRHELRVILLNTDTSETDLGLLASSLATDTSLGVLGQVEEDLAVKHTIFVQVEDLRIS